VYIVEAEMRVRFTVTSLLLSKCGWRGVLVGLGIRKIRITGGEPLLRKGVVEFVRGLAKLRSPLQIPNGRGSTDAVGEASFVPPFRTMVHIGG